MSTQIGIPFGDWMGRSVFWLAAVCVGNVGGLDLSPFLHARPGGGSEPCAHEVWWHYMQYWLQQYRPSPQQIDTPYRT
ncbi:hypothetical protein [Primorskyibacter marinus]|uniref:hypothetical protein n=1 Tax=Primorskyibacter marinus TaxID=1977320 RepID=UPI00130041EC|nr:hypothetical protein [Primorskyibacter marinus]